MYLKKQHLNMLHQKLYNILAIHYKIIYSEFFVKM